MTTIRKHDGHWRDQPGWEVVHERFDASTGLLAIVAKNNRLKLLKADLFARFELSDEPRPRWEPVGCVEAIFALNDLEQATQFLERAIIARRCEPTE